MVSFKDIRLAECQCVRRWFKPGMRVLEIGGGSGYQAYVIARWGCSVSSVDITDRQSQSVHYYPVQDYDGHHLPFQDCEFDIVFSSNVLEHIAHLSTFSPEICRVLKPGGMAIHILPTPTWRFWTILTHHPFLVKYVYTKYLTRPNSPQLEDDFPLYRSTENNLEKYKLTKLLWRALVPKAHGEFPNAISELWYFSRQRWLRQFSRYQFQAVEDYPTHLFYTGHLIFSGLELRTRQKLSKVLGSACRVYVMRQTTH